MKEVTIAAPFQFKNGFQSKNRFFKSAMSEQLADSNHNPTFGLQRLYKVWAEGGLGIIVSGNLMVDREHLGEPKNVVLDASSDLQKFKAWTQAGSANGAKFWAQLNHPGKQAPKFIQPNPVAPSAIALEGGLQANFNKPRALQDSEIQSIIAKFAQSARLAKEVGFAGVQIHGAHGYLINQFLSARHNQRDDSWGGSIQNRMRFLLEIYNAVRQQVGSNFPVGVKLNSADFMRGGFTEAESMTVVQSLAVAGIDLIEISGGSYEAPAMADGVQRKNSTIKREAYFLEYAEKVRALVDIPIVVTGGFRTVAGMNEALAGGATDLIGIARPLAVQPDLPNRALADDSYSVHLRPLSTGFKKLDDMVLLNMSWYETQFDRIAKGKSPNPGLSEWYATWKVLQNLGVYAFKKRRA